MERKREEGYTKFNYFKRGVRKIGKLLLYMAYNSKADVIEIPPRRGELNTGTYFLTININCYLITPILA